MKWWREKWSFVKEYVSNLKWLMGIVWNQQGGRVGIMLVVGMLLSNIPLLRAGVLGWLIDSLISSSEAWSWQSVWWVVGGLVALEVVPEVVGSLYVFLSGRVWFKVREYFELLLLKKKGEIDVARYEDAKFKDLLQLAEERGVAPLSNLVSSVLYILRELWAVAVAGAVLFWIDWRLCVVVGLSAIPKLYVEAVYGQNVWWLYGAESETRRRYFDLQRYYDYLPYLVELKMFGNVGNFWVRMREMIVGFGDKLFGQEKVRLWWELGAMGVNMVGLAVAFFLVVSSVIEGRSSVGDLAFFLGALSSFEGSMRSLMWSVGSQVEDGLFVSSIRKVLRIENVVKVADKPVLPKSGIPRIEFEEVSFRYEGMEKWVLEDFNLVLEPGMRLALVGVNGAGKTTFVKLLCRFYDPSRGRILIDGVDLKELDLEAWREKLAVLFQDFTTYNFSVEENITLGRSSVKSDEKRLKWAGQVSDAEEFIVEWPLQYKQQIGKEFKGGVEPSKGQRQKLALARAVYRRAEVLIMDEPTAAVDVESEMRIFEMLEGLKRSQTMILISHRFSTVRNADVIGVVKDGRLVELGSHEKLVKQGRIYAGLFESQARKYR